MASAIRIAEPAHRAEVEALVARRRRRVVTVADERDHATRGSTLALEEGVFCEPSSAAGSPALAQVELEPGSTVVCVLTGHGLKDTAAVDVLRRADDRRRADVESILAEVARVSGSSSAPATTANLGPGFDCAAAALDLWNELEVDRGRRPLVDLEGEGADELPRGRRTSRSAPSRSSRRSRATASASSTGSRSSAGSARRAATIAAGLVAGAAVAGRDARPPTSCSRSGCRSRATPTTSRPRSRGGVCLIWRAAAAASRGSPTDLPLAPIAVVPQARVNTTESRARAARSSVSHEDAAYTAAQRALLGAAIASGDAELLAAALPRPPARAVPRRDAPLLDELRADPPPGAAGVDALRLGPVRHRLGATEPARRGAAERSRARFPTHEILPLADHAEQEPDPHEQSTVRSPTDPAKRHSAALTDGVDRAAARAMLKGDRLHRRGPREAARRRRHDVDRDDAVQPQPARARQAREGAASAQAGGTPIEFNTISVSDGVSMGTTGMRASLISREVIADSIELVAPATSSTGSSASSAATRRSPPP